MVLDLNNNFLDSDFNLIKRFIENINPVEDGLLGEIQAYAFKNNIPVISREMSGFMSLILNLKRPRRILELGCAIGYSSILMSKFLAKDGFIISIERSEKMLEIAKKNITRANISCIDLIYGDINNVLPELVINNENKFDIIFMDAAKGQYIKILPICLDLLNQDGIIIADDVLQHGNIIKNRLDVPRRQRTIYSRMREFIKKVFDNKIFKSNFFSIGDGVVIAQKI